MSSVLVTGAAGFTDAHVTHALVQRGEHDVVTADDLSGGFRENLPESITFVRQSLSIEELYMIVFAIYKFKVRHRTVTAASLARLLGGVSPRRSGGLAASRGIRGP